MKSFLVLKILDEKGAFFPHTMFYDGVEIRSPKADSTKEINGLKISAKSANVDFEHYMICSRIAVIVEANDREKAIEIADRRFSVILDLLSSNIVLSSFTLSPIGFTKDLSTGDLCPITEHGYKASTSFFRHHGRLQTLDLNQVIIAKKSELAERYLRSLHWRRNSKNESNIQLKILFDYFSAEALFKERDGDNIGGYIRWFMGFPNGTDAKRVSPDLSLNLKSNARYLFWNRKLMETFDTMRTFRNKSVHNGFRSLEFTPLELELYQQVMVYGITRSQGAVRTAITNGVSSICEMKEYLPELFEMYISINDVHNNIIYGLDKLYQN